MAGLRTVRRVLDSMQASCLSHLELSMESDSSGHHHQPSSPLREAD